MLKTETDRGLKIQEDLVRKLDAELQQVYYDNIGPQEAKTVQEDSTTAKYINAVYDESTKKYTFTFNENGNANCLDVLNKYFSDRQLALYEVQC